MAKIQHKRSSVVEGGAAKQPTAAQTEYGELCVNYSTDDPALFIKDDTEGIRRVGGDLSLYQKIEELPPSVEISPNKPLAPQEGTLWWADTDIEEGGGRLYVYTGDEWVDVSLPGNGFSGEYNDLDGKPDLYDLDYLSSINDDTAAGEITFEGQTTHEGGVKVTGDSSNLGIDIDVSANNSASGLKVTPGLNGVAITARNSNTAGLTNTVQIESDYAYASGKAALRLRNHDDLSSVNSTALSVYDGADQNVRINFDGSAYFKGPTEHAGGVKVTGTTSDSHIFADVSNAQYIQFGGNGRTLATFATDINNVGNGAYFGGTTCQLSTSESDINLVRCVYNNGGHGAGQNLSLINNSVEVNTSAQRVSLYQADSGAQQSGKLYAFYSGISNSDSSDEAYNFYAAGTAPNFFGGRTIFSNSPDVSSILAGTQNGKYIQPVDGNMISGVDTADNRTHMTFTNPNGFVGRLETEGNNLRIIGLAGGPLLRNGIDLDSSEGLVEILKQAYDTIQDLKSRIEELESNTLQPLYSTLADLPDASEHHGKTAHVHSEGALYFAHAGNWVKLQNA